MRKTGLFISVGCVFAALGACSGDPAPDGSANDGELPASTAGTSTNSTVTEVSSTTSATATGTATSSTGASQGGPASSGSLSGSSSTGTSAVATTGTSTSMTSGTSTTGVGMVTDDVGGQGGTAFTSAGDVGGAGGSGATGTGGSGTSSTGGGTTTGTFPEGCEVSTPVSFARDIQPFLAASCGKGVDSGCHVTDADSTMGSLCPDGSNNCGFTHAYDWITAGAHASSCPETPTPKRFEVVLDVIDQATAPSCSNSRIMPPPGMGTPLTQCEIAALKAWLSEPKVVQAHRADDSSPEEPYEMPPFN